MVLVNPGGEPIVKKIQRFTELFKSSDQPEIVAVDIPIGLLDEAKRGGRECDRLARETLRSPRRNSVFSPPVRGTLQHSDDYNTAKEANRRSSEERIAISLQAYGILKKILEVDDILIRSPHLRDKVMEVHPELCFYEMNHCGAMKQSKKSEEGFRERLRLLQQIEEFKHAADIIRQRPSGIGRDDILDAFAACWTALRIEGGKAIPLPENVPTDAKGLRMQIWR